MKLRSAILVTATLAFCVLSCGSSVTSEGTNVRGRVSVEFVTGSTGYWLPPAPYDGPFDVFTINIDGLETMTDQRGVYRLPSVPEGLVSMTVTGPGGGTCYRTLLNLTTKKAVVNVNIEVTSSGPFSGGGGAIQFVGSSSGFFGSGYYSGGRTQTGSSCL